MNFYVIIVLLLIFIFCGFMGRLLNKKSLIFFSLAMKYIVYVLVFLVLFFNDLTETYAIVMTSNLSALNIKQAALLVTSLMAFIDIFDSLFEMVDTKK